MPAEGLSPENTERTRIENMIESAFVAVETFDHNFSQNKYLKSLDLNLDDSLDLHIKANQKISELKSFISPGFLDYVQREAQMYGADENKIQELRDFVATTHLTEKFAFLEKTFGQQKFIDRVVTIIKAREVATKVLEIIDRGGNYYEVLNLPVDASDRQIKDAYHRLLKILYPDFVDQAINDKNFTDALSDRGRANLAEWTRKNGSEGILKKAYLKIDEIRDRLANPANKTAYDSELRRQGKDKSNLDAWGGFSAQFEPEIDIESKFDDLFSYNGPQTEKTRQSSSKNSSGSGPGTGPDLGQEETSDGTATEEGGNNGSKGPKGPESGSSGPEHKNTEEDQKLYEKITDEHEPFGLDQIRSLVPQLENSGLSDTQKKECRQSIMQDLMTWYAKHRPDLDPGVKEQRLREFFAKLGVNPDLYINVETARSGEKYSTSNLLEFLKNEEYAPKNQDAANKLKDMLLGFDYSASQELSSDTYKQLVPLVENFVASFKLLFNEDKSISTTNIIDYYKRLQAVNTFLKALVGIRTNDGHLKELYAAIAELKEELKENTGIVERKPLSEEANNVKEQYKDKSLSDMIHDSITGDIKFGNIDEKQQAARIALEERVFEYRDRFKNAEDFVEFQAVMSSFGIMAEFGIISGDTINKSNLSARAKEMQKKFEGSDGARRSIFRFNCNKWMFGENFQFEGFDFQNWKFKEGNSDKKGIIALIIEAAYEYMRKPGSGGYPKGADPRAVANYDEEKKFSIASGSAYPDVLFKHLQNTDFLSDHHGQPLGFNIKERLDEITNDEDLQWSIMRVAQIIMARDNMARKAEKYRRIQDLSAPQSSLKEAYSPAMGEDGATDDYFFEEMVYQGGKPNRDPTLIHIAVNKLPPTESDIVYNPEKSTRAATYKAVEEYILDYFDTLHPLWTTKINGKPSVLDQIRYDVETFEDDSVELWDIMNPHNSGPDSYLYKDKSYTEFEESYAIFMKSFTEIPDYKDAATVGNKIRSLGSQLSRMKEILGTPKGAPEHYKKLKNRFDRAEKYVMFFIARIFEQVKVEETAAASLFDVFSVRQQNELIRQGRVDSVQKAVMAGVESGFFESHREMFYRLKDFVDRNKQAFSLPYDVQSDKYKLTVVNYRISSVLRLRPSFFGIIGDQLTNGNDADGYILKPALEKELRRILESNKNADKKEAELEKLNKKYGVNILPGLNILKPF